MNIELHITYITSIHCEGTFAPGYLAQFTRSGGSAQYTPAGQAERVIASWDTPLPPIIAPLLKEFLEQNRTETPLPATFYLRIPDPEEFPDQRAADMRALALSVDAAERDGALLGIPQDQLTPLLARLNGYYYQGKDFCVLIPQIEGELCGLSFGGERLFQSQEKCASCEDDTPSSEGLAAAEALNAVEYSALFVPPEADTTEQHNNHMTREDIQNACRWFFRSPVIRLGMFTLCAGTLMTVAALQVRRCILQKRRTEQSPF